MPLIPLSAAETAKRYHENNKVVVRNRENLYRKVQRLTIKVKDSIKNTERLKSCIL